ncbi:MAG: flagellar motor switch protein FliN [Granulosicoccus sp.]|nr:flagellar motor switch protein FliN [Granulosicoccus sp.]
MAEENTAEELNDEADPSSTDAPDESTDSAEVEAQAAESETSSDESQESDAQSTDDVAQETDSDAPAEPANEPTIGDEVPVMESPVVSTGSGDLAISDISMILDIPVTLSMEIGQTRISIKELLKLGKDSVIELQRMADEPMDVLVNGTLVAHGEAVVVGDRFGIRLTDVISPQERLRKFT